MPIACILIDDGIGACQKMRKSEECDGSILLGGWGSIETFCLLGHFWLKILPKELV